MREVHWTVSAALLLGTVGAMTTESTSGCYEESPTPDPSPTAPPATPTPAPTPEATPVPTPEPTLTQTPVPIGPALVHLVVNTELDDSTRGAYRDGVYTIRLNGANELCFAFDNQVQLTGVQLPGDTGWIEQDVTGPAEYCVPVPVGYTGDEIDVALRWNTTIVWNRFVAGTLMRHVDTNGNPSFAEMCGNDCRNSVPVLLSNSSLANTYEYTQWVIPSNVPGVKGFVCWSDYPIPVPAQASPAGVYDKCVGGHTEYTSVDVCYFQSRVYATLAEQMAGAVLVNLRLAEEELGPYFSADRYVLMQVEVTGYNVAYGSRNRTQVSTGLLDDEWTGVHEMFHYWDILVECVEDIAVLEEGFVNSLVWLFTHRAMTRELVNEEGFQDLMDQMHSYLLYIQEYESSVVAAPAGVCSALDFNLNTYYVSYYYRMPLMLYYFWLREDGVEVDDLITVFREFTEERINTYAGREEFYAAIEANTGVSLRSGSDGTDYIADWLESPGSFIPPYVHFSQGARRKAESYLPLLEEELRSGGRIHALPTSMQERSESAAMWWVSVDTSSAF